MSSSLLAAVRSATGGAPEVKTIRVQSAWGGPEYEVSLDDIAMVSINPAEVPLPCDYGAQFWLKSYSTPISLEKPEGLRLRAAWLEHLLEEQAKPKTWAPVGSVLQRAAEAERAAIVKYLKDGQCSGVCCGCASLKRTIERLEAGEHLNGDD